MKQVWTLACWQLAMAPSNSWAALAHEQVAAARAHAAPLHGRIVAASLGTGDAVVFPFTLGQPAVALVAHSQELTAAAHRSRRREGTAQQGFRGQLALVPGVVMLSLLPVWLSVSHVRTPSAPSLRLCSHVHHKALSVAVCC